MGLLILLGGMYSDTEVEGSAIKTIHSEAHTFMLYAFSMALVFVQSYIDKLEQICIIFSNLVLVIGNLLR